jgi:hypothetical protein
MCDLILIAVAMAILGGSIIVSNYLVRKGLGAWDRSPDGEYLPAAAHADGHQERGCLQGKRLAPK